MDLRLRNPTSYPEINSVLEALLSGVQTVLGDQFVGFYLHGSLATGDFNLKRSDIDFLVVTEDELSPNLYNALEDMHARLTASGMPWATKLEGSYIPLDCLRRYDPEHALHPALRVDGTFAIDGHGIDWVIQRHMIREGARVVAGPSVQGLIDPIPEEEICRAARGILLEWWQPMLSNTSQLQTEEYRAYAVLTMCRALYTLRHAHVTTKSNAAHWAQDDLGEAWAGLIEKALAWPEGPQPINLDETLRFIRFTLERCT